MPTPAGLFDTGLVILTQPEVLDQIELDQRSNVSNEINQEAASLVGNYNGIVSDAVAAVWELARDVYNSQFPNFASGYSLSQLVQLTRTRRNPATKSAVPATVNVNPGSYAIGTLVAMVTGRPDHRFINAEVVTNGGGSAANIPALFECEQTGPIAAPSGSLVIAEPTAGWNSITTAVDAELGKNIESDQNLRLRREQELASGSSTADAIRARILRELSDDGVRSVRVLVNDGDVVDSNGVPPHSFEAIVLGPDAPTLADNQALADVIRLAKADGLRAAGSTVLTRLDSQGNELNIGFTRPADVNIWVVLNISVDPATFPGDAAVKSAITAVVYNPGDDVSFFKVACVPFGVAGVKDIISGAIGTAPAPVSTASIPIDIRQVARFDSTRITINIV